MIEAETLELLTQATLAQAATMVRALTCDFCRVDCAVAFIHWGAAATRPSTIPEMIPQLAMLGPWSVSANQWTRRSNGEYSTLAAPLVR